MGDPGDCPECAEIDGLYTLIPSEGGGCSWETHGNSVDAYWFFDGFSWNLLVQVRDSDCASIAAVYSDSPTFPCVNGVTLTGYVVGSRCSVVLLTIEPQWP